MESHLDPPAVNPGSRGMIHGARVLRGILENYEFNSPREKDTSQPLNKPLWPWAT